MDKFVNRHNSRYVTTSHDAVDPAVRFSSHQKFPTKAMLFAYIGMDGTAFPPVWIDGTLNSHRSKEILMRKVIPLLDATYSCGNYVRT